MEMAMPRYHVFGLRIDSELELPPLTPGPPVGEPEVRIRWGRVPEHLEEPRSSGLLFEAAPGAFLLRTSPARILVSAGTELVVEALQEDLTQLRIFLLGSCLGALLHQRGLLVLHGSAVQTPRGAVVFVGPSGAGKSTILGAMLHRGYALLADDLAAMDAEGDARIRVLPAIPRVRLWPDSVEQLGLAPGNLPREMPEREKVVLPVAASASEPVPLFRIYVLDGQGHAAAISLETLPRFQALEELVRQTYRLRYLEGLGTRKEHFRLASLAAGQASVVRVTRPRRSFLLEELADCLEADFRA